MILLPFLIIGFWLYDIWLHVHLVNLSGDVEKIPGPKSYSAQYLRICHRQLKHRSSQFQNFQIAFLKGYPFGYCMLSETFLDNSILINDDSLQIPGYTFLRADHPSKPKRGWVLLYFKSFLPIKLTNKMWIT